MVCCECRARFQVRLLTTTDNCIAMLEDDGVMVCCECRARFQVRLLTTTDNCIALLEDDGSWSAANVGLGSR